MQPHESTAVDTVSATTTTTAPQASSSTGKGFDVEAVRGDFPALHQEVNGKPLVYLDNAASSQTPQAVLDAMMHFYTRDYANIHRGVHALSQRATESYEAVRGKVQHFLNAEREEEIIFVRGTTEAINLVAHSYVAEHLQEGDEVLVTGMEHHSNIVPWQLLADRLGIVLTFVPIDEDGSFPMEAFVSRLTSRTKLVSVVHMSNALGTINPVKEIIDHAHQRDIPVLLDGAQSAPHMAIDVQELDCDFFAFSGHKLFGPTGIGVLYGKMALLEKMAPYQGGGDMIHNVTFEGSTYAPPPARFEAGTPHIAGVIGLGAAIDYLNALDMDAIAEYEEELLTYATEAVGAIPGVRIIGTAAQKASVLSFVVDGVHPHDLGTILDSVGVAIRTGHHCAQPVMDHFSIPATARASFAFYNTKAEVDALVEGLKKAISLFA
jgi:cysteine desulfurase/selenocysteine lyase